MTATAQYLTAAENYQASLEEARALPTAKLAEEVKFYQRHALAMHNWAVKAYEDAWKERMGTEGAL